MCAHIRSDEGAGEFQPAVVHGIPDYVMDIFYPDEVLPAGTTCINAGLSAADVEKLAATIEDML